MRTLRRGREVDQAFTSGKRWRGRSVMLICARRPVDGLRVAFATAKTLGCAVRRNRQRRRLREACRKLWPRISTESADLVVMALPPAEGCPFGALQRELEGLLTRAGLLSEPAARSPGAP